MGSGKLLLPIILHFVFISHAFAQSIIQVSPHKTRIAADHKIRVNDGLYCESWKFSIETNDAGSWNNIPSRCVKFVQDYMTGDRYLSDSDVVSEYGLDFAKTVNVSGDVKDAWVFDIDETLLSNLPYYEVHGFGYACDKGIDRDFYQMGSECNVGWTLPRDVFEWTNSFWRSEVFDENSFNDWVDLAEAPALPASLNLYNELKQLGFKIFLLTGRSEYQRNATEKNLLFSGYSGWEKLILRSHLDQGKTATVYKSEKRSELVNQGYRIHGSSGDQWSDLQGFSVAKRSFKLPNPMYYIA
ncbi:hypothetical protein JRO89_XS04G0219900 [Xanthoceras sorbifolium]|uniref:Acid phosphatase n=1 Tax=Xanthoceras sorbifolium TaxID=99658 RepID=A0ABQ8I6F3_9ROSI|nr:hypothetical protein JRO89_XS04G0219900 [Xanthoceras sorbifolium]